MVILFKAFKITLYAGKVCLRHKKLKIVQFFSEIVFGGRAAK